MSKWENKADDNNRRMRLKNMRILLVILGAIIAVLIIAYVVFMGAASKTMAWTEGLPFSNYVRPTETSSPAPTATPTPTPVATADATGDPSASASPGEEQPLWELEKHKYEGIELTKILFIGDSVTQGLDIYQTLPGANVIANKGMSSYSLMEHLETVVALKPDTIFILLGLNDMSGKLEDGAYIDNYGNFVRSLQKALPDARIVVQAMFAVSKEVDETHEYVKNEIIDRFNQDLLKMANDLNVIFADVRSVFQDKDGTMRTDISPDGIHVYSEYYYLWTEKLIPYMK